MRYLKKEEVPFIQIIEGNSVNVGSINIPEVVSTSIHCHDLRPVTSNKKAWKKLLIASSLCFLFAVGEVIGNVSYLCNVSKSR